MSEKLTLLEIADELMAMAETVAAATSENGASIIREAAYQLRICHAAPELLAALTAAMMFIDSHVADPDITEEMARNYAALEAMQPHAVIARAVSRAALSPEEN